MSGSATWIHGAFCQKILRYLVSEKGTFIIYFTCFGAPSTCPENYRTERRCDDSRFLGVERSLDTERRQRTKALAL